MSNTTKWPGKLE